MTHLRQLCLMILLLLGAVATGLCADAKPAAHREVVRVVSQTVGTDELLVALARPGQIAALSALSRNADYSAIAKQARAYPQLKPNGDAEDALQYGPTLVLCADYSRAEFVDQIRLTGVKVIVFRHYFTLQDSFDNLRVLGLALGREKKAEEIIADCRRRVEDLRRRLAGCRPVRVIAPSVYGVIPGYDTTFEDLCDHAGAVNLAATLGGLHGHAAPPSEQMLTWPIDRVVVAGNSLAEALQPFRHLAPYAYMAAIREKRAVLLRPFLLSCVSQYRVEGYEDLARALHPECFRK